MASVLKRKLASGRADSSGLVAFNSQDLHDLAKEHLRKATAEAARIVQQAEQEAESLKESARLEGAAIAQDSARDQADTLAREMCAAQSQSLLSGCESQVRQLQNDTFEWLAEWRNQTVSLAVAIAEKVIKQSIDDDRQAIVEAWLEDALRSIVEARTVRIKLNPRDLSIAEQTLHRIANTVPCAASAQLVASDAIEPGGGIVESEQGEIDNQISTQLQRLAAQLR